MAFTPTALRVYRAAAGASQEELAQKAGISRPTLSNLERGVTRPLPLTARAVAAALGQPVEAVFPNENDPQPPATAAEGPKADNGGPDES